MVVLFRTRSLLTLDSIVFVHGLFGHPYKTWAGKGATTTSTPDTLRPKFEDGSREATPPTSFWRKPKRLISRRTDLTWASSSETLTEEANSSSQDVFWPQDLLPKAVPSARVFTWGYDVDVGQFLSSSSTLSVSQHAETLLSDLSNVRTTYWTRSTKIIFVAHSLGGIVVKKHYAPLQPPKPNLETSCVRPLVSVFWGHRTGVLELPLGESWLSTCLSYSYSNPTPISCEASKIILRLYSISVKISVDSWSTEAFTFILSEKNIPIMEL